MANLQNYVSAESLLIFDAIAKESLCHFCNEYLSVPPIMMVTGGYRICGHCNPPPSMVAVYRDTILEEILKLISFPCRYQQAGCPRRILFDEVTDHESRCSYRTIFCPLTCTWNGAVPKLPKHIKSNHKESARKKAIIELEVTKNKSETLMITHDEFIHFLIKYVFNFKTCSLEYDVRYQTVQRECEDVSFEVSYYNLATSNSIVKLKSKTCPEFDESFSGMQNVTVVNLKKFYAALENPDCMTIAIDFKFWLITLTGSRPVNVRSSIVD